MLSCLLSCALGAVVFSRDSLNTPVVVSSLKQLSNITKLLRYVSFALNMSLAFTNHSTLYIYSFDDRGAIYICSPIFIQMQYIELVLSTKKFHAFQTKFLVVTLLREVLTQLLVTPAGYCTFWNILHE
jgi:hypothetical protein